MTDAFVPMEKWRDIPGFPGYRVSDRGRVRGKRGRILKFGEHKEGYLFINLCSKRNTKQMRVHRLVLMAFRGMPKPGQVSRHLDGNRTNNGLGNLKWGTQKENQADRERHGTGQRGEQSGLSKLTEKQVKEIRELYLTGEYIQKELGKKFGVSQQQINKIINRQRWAHLE